MHADKVTVRCGLWAGFVIGRHFFKDTANSNVTMNDGFYGELTSNDALE